MTNIDLRRPDSDASRSALRSLVNREGQGRRAGVAGLAFVATLGGFLGCGQGDPDAIPAVPAAGTVSYKGKPVEKGTVQFVPEKGRTASGTIEGGRFTLTTYQEGDGAVPGRHQVGIVSTKEVPAKKQGMEPGAVSLIPDRFVSPDTSGVSVEIPAGGNKEIKLDLQ